MKKIFSYAMLLLAGTFAMTSCNKDLDSNPTIITEPSQIVLNQPNLAATVDLKNATEFETLSWSQPQYTTMNAPVVAYYTVQMATKEDFSDAFNYVEDQHDSLTLTVTPYDLDFAMQQAYGWADESAVPTSTDLYARVIGNVKNASSEIVSTDTSNVIKMSVAPYFLLLKAADPVFWYLIGGDICDGTWGSDIPTCVIPMEPIEGESYDVVTGYGKIHWIGYLAGNGFKLRGDMTDGWATQWGQGDSFGTYVMNDGGSVNITVPEAGVYEVTLNTSTNTLDVQAYTGSAKCYDGMAISGSFNNWGDDAMSPVHTVAGANNHDWYITYTFAKGDEVKFKQAGSWDFNKGGTLIDREDGYYGFGVSNGDNLVIKDSGKYLIIFNDITGSYRFIKQ